MTNIQFLRQTVLQDRVDRNVRMEALDRLLVACGGGEMCEGQFVPNSVAASAKEFLGQNRKIKAVALYREEFNIGLKEAKTLVDLLEKEMEEAAV